MNPSLETNRLKRKSKHSLPEQAQEKIQEQVQDQRIEIVAPLESSVNAHILEQSSQKALKIFRSDKNFSLWSLVLYFSLMAISFGILLTSMHAYAEQSPSPLNHNVVQEDGKTVIYKKRNVVEFDGSLIEGEVKNPSEFYFVHRPEEKFGTLIKRRKNFHKEMLRDTVMLR